MADKCFICGNPINPRGFFNRIRGDECHLTCSRECAVREEEQYDGYIAPFRKVTVGAEDRKNILAEEKHQCRRCGAILPPKTDSGATLCGFPVIMVPSCPRCGWMAKSKESVN